MEAEDTDSLSLYRFAEVLKQGPEQETPDCPEPERMIALAAHELTETEAVPLLAHVALCSRCRREYAETAELLHLSQKVGASRAQSVPQSVPGPPEAAAPAERVPAPASRKLSLREMLRGWFSPGMGFAFGAAMAGIALFFTLTAPAQRQRDRLNAALHERTAQMARAEQDKQTLIRERDALQKKDGDLPRFAAEIHRLNAQIKAQEVEIARGAAAETTLQQIPLPAAAWKTVTDSGQVRGTNQNEARPPEIVLLRPVDTALEAASPVLECRPVPGASAYRVTLEKEGSPEELPAPRPLAPTRWQVALPLQSGVYRWAVTAQGKERSLHSPFVRFYILSAADRVALAEARRKFAHAPLTLGAVYARLGLSDAARQQFQKAVRVNPQDAAAKRWLAEFAAQDKRGAGN